MVPAVQSGLAQSPPCKAKGPQVFLPPTAVRNSPASWANEKQGPAKSKGEPEATAEPRLAASLWQEAREQGSDAPQQVRTRPWLPADSHLAKATQVHRKTEAASQRGETTFSWGGRAAIGSNLLSENSPRGKGVARLSSRNRPAALILVSLSWDRPPLSAAGLGPREEGAAFVPRLRRSSKANPPSQQAPGPRCSPLPHLASPTATAAEQPVGVRSCHQRGKSRNGEGSPKGRSSPPNMPRRPVSPEGLPLEKSRASTASPFPTQTALLLKKK